MDREPSDHPAGCRIHAVEVVALQRVDLLGIHIKKVKEVDAPSGDWGGAS